MVSANYTRKDLESAKVQNRVVTELRPLVVKIVNQWVDRCPLDRDMLTMLAEDGILDAIHKWHEGTNQNLFQYAGWCIRYSILNGIAEYGSTVKIGAWKRSEMIRCGQSTHVMVSIDSFRKDDETGELRLDIPFNDKAIDVDSPDKVMERLIDFVERNFNERTRDIFYRTYGINGRDVTKGNTLCKMYGVSDARVSQIVHSVISKIRQSSSLMEILDTIR